MPVFIPLSFPPRFCPLLALPWLGHPFVSVSICTGVCPLAVEDQLVTFRGHDMSLEFRAPFVGVLVVSEPSHT